MASRLYPLISVPVSVHVTTSDFTVNISLLYPFGELVVSVTSCEEGFHVAWQFISGDLSLVGLGTPDGRL